MDIFKERYSCRSYSERPVEREKLMAVLEAAQYAPSACNKQPWTFLVVDDEPGRQAVAKSYGRDWIMTAPMYIIVFGHHNEAWHRPCDGKDHTDIDIAIAVEHLCLKAAEEGLATCWVCNFDPKVIVEEYGVSEGIEPIAILPLGYAAEGTNAPVKKRKTLEEIVKWNTLR